MGTPVWREPWSPCPSAPEIPTVLLNVPVDIQHLVGCLATSRTLDSCSSTRISPEHPWDITKGEDEGTIPPKFIPNIPPQRQLHAQHCEC